MRNVDSIIKSFNIELVSITENKSNWNIWRYHHWLSVCTWHRHVSL